MAPPPQDIGSLSSMARLEQPCTTPGEVMPITFDVILPCKNNTAISPILFNAHYGREGVREIVE
jgi:hypothetical protein